MELLCDKVILSDRVVLIGATVLATNGYYIKSYPISFAGTYSVLSKFSYFDLHSISLEVAKLLVSIGVWLGIVLLLFIRSNGDSILSKCTRYKNWKSIPQEDENDECDEIKVGSDVQFVT